MKILIFGGSGSLGTELRKLNADYYNKLQAKYLAAVEVFIEERDAKLTESIGLDDGRQGAFRND